MPDTPGHKAEVYALQAGRDSGVSTFIANLKRLFRRDLADIEDKTKTTLSILAGRTRTLLARVKATEDRIVVLEARIKDLEGTPPA